MSVNILPSCNKQSWILNLLKPNIFPTYNAFIHVRTYMSVTYWRNKQQYWVNDVCYTGHIQLTDDTRPKSVPRKSIMLCEFNMGNAYFITTCTCILKIFTNGLMHFTRKPYFLKIGTRKLTKSSSNSSGGHRTEINSALHQFNRRTIWDTNLEIHRRIIRGLKST